jgi:hypothetical protein
MDAVSHTYTVIGTYQPKYQVHGTNNVWSAVCNYPYQIIVLTSLTPSITSTPTLTTTSTLPLRGDVSGQTGTPDGVVDLFDYNAIVEQYGNIGAPEWIPEDVSGEAGVPDGVIDLYDLNVIIENYGKTQ